MKPHWIETEIREELIEPLTDMMIALHEGDGVQGAMLIFDNEGQEEKVAVRLFHNDEGYHIELYDESPDKDHLLKKIEREMKEGFGRSSKVFFDRDDFFSIKAEDFMGSEITLAHLGGGNIYFDIPLTPYVTGLIAEFYKLILKEENQ